MAKIEERIVSMKFDNKQFKVAASETLSTLENLKSKLKFDKVGKIFGNADKEIQSMSKSVNAVDFSNMSQQLTQIQNQWSTMGTISRTVVSSMTKSVMGLATKGFQSIVDPIVGGGMRRAQNLEQANFMLDGIVGKEIDGANKIKGIMEDANYAVDQTAFGLDSAAKAAAQFAANGMRAGTEMRSALRGISGVASMTSSSYDDIASIFTTVAGQGRLMTDQLNQLAFRGLNAASTLAKHFGVTEAELRDMVSKGKVQFSDFAEAMDEAFGAQAAKSNETFTGALSNLKAALGRIGADVATPYLQNMRDIFNSLRISVNEVRKTIKPFIDVINTGGKQATDTIVRMLGTFNDALSAYNDPAKTAGPGWTKFFDLIRSGAAVFDLVRQYVIDVVKVLGGATPSFIKMGTTFGETGTKVLNIFRKLLSFFMLVPETIGAILKEVFNLGDGFGSIGSSVLDVIDNIASFLYLTAEFVRSTKVIQLIGKAFGFVAKAVVGAVSAVAGFVAIIGAGLVKVLEFFSPVISVIKRATDGIVKFFGQIKNFKLPRITFRPFENLGETVKSLTGWFKELWASVRGMDFGKAFKMGSLSGVRNFATGAKDALGGAMSGFNTDGIKTAFGKIGGYASSAFNFVKSIDYKGIASTVLNGIKSAFSWTGEKILDFGKWIQESLSDIDWSNVGSTISNGLIKAVHAVASSTGAIISFFNDLFTGIFESIDWDALFGSFKDGFENIKGAWDEIKAAFSGEELETDFLEQAIGEVNADATLNVATDIGRQMQTFSDTIRGYWDSLFGRGSDGLGDTQVAKDIEKVGTDVRMASAALSNPFGTAKANISGFFKDLGESMKESAEQMLDGVNISNLMSSMGVLAGGLGTLEFGRAARDIAALPKSISEVFTGIKDSITAIGDAAKIEARGNSILKIAAALAIFAGSAYLLSRVPWDELKVGLGATMAILGALIGSMVLMDKVLSEESSDKLKSLSKALLMMGISVGLLAGSAYLLSKLDLGEILKGLLTIVGMVAALAGGVALAGLAGSISGLGWAFMGLAIGVGILAASLLVFKMVSYEDIKKGMITLAGALLSLSVAAKIADGKSLAGAGLAMLGLGVGLLGLSFGLKAIANLETDELIKSITVMAGVMAAITLMSRFSGNMAATAGTLIGVAAAMVGLAYAIKLISDIDFGSAFGGMSVIVLGMIGLGLALRAFPKDMPAIAASLVGIAGAIGILVAAIWVIGNMDTGTVVQGMLALGVALAGFAVALNFVPAGSMLKVTGIALGMLALAGALIVFAAAMRSFETVDWGSMGKAAAVVAGLAVVIGLIAGFGVAMAPGLMAFGASLAVIGAGLLVIAGAAWVFADAVSKVIDSITGLADQGGKIKDALREAGEGITEFSNGADEGLRNLFATFDEAGAVDVGKIALLFKTLSDIPQDMDARLDGLVSGLEKIQEVLPIMTELTNFGGQVGWGDNRSIGGFFRALGKIDPEAGSNLSSVVQGLKDIETVIPIMEKLQDLGSTIDEGALGFIGGDNNALSGFFRTLGRLDPEAGSNLSSVVQGLRDIDTVIPIMERLQGLGSQIDEGGLGFIGGDNNALSGFFKTFEKIDPSTGANISSFVDGITQLDGAMEAIQRVQALSTRVDGGWFGGGGDNGQLSGFFSIFDSIGADTGANISSFVTGIQALDGQFEAIQRLTSLSSFIKVDNNNNLSSFFNSLSGSITSDMGANMSAASAGMQELSESIPLINDSISQLQEMDLGSFQASMSQLGEAMTGGVIDGLSNAASTISEAVNAMLTAVTDKSDSFRNGGVQLANAIGEGIQSGEGELRIRVSTVVTNSASGVEATARSSFRSVGAAMTEGMAAGMTAGPVIAKAREIAASAKAAAEAELKIKSPSRVFRQIGKYVVDGFAQGMSKDDASRGAARDMAKGVIRTSEEEFDIHSPSRVYRRIGNQINQGLADGLRELNYMPIDALNDTFKAMGLVVKEGMANIDDIVTAAAAASPLTSYLDSVSREARKTRKDQLAQRKKDAKEEDKRLKDQLYDAEKALLDYEDSIIDAEDSIKDAQKEMSETKKETNTTKSGAKDEKKDAAAEARKKSKAERDLAKKKRDLDAARRQRGDKLEAIEKAKQERAWYDANIQGYLAGEAFAEGTESGLKDADEKLKTENELFVELLTEKVNETKEHMSNVRDAVGSLREIGDIFENTSKSVKNFERAFNRLNTSTTDRSARRNLSIMLDSVLEIGDEMIKVVSLYERFEPFLVDALNRMDKMLPTFLPMIMQIAPNIGAQLSQGLLVALPKIVGAAGGIIAAIAGIGIFLYDMGKDQKIYKFLKSILNNIIKLVVKLPQIILGAITTMLKGLTNLIKELPQFIPEIIEAIIEGLVSMVEQLPDLLVAVIEALVEVFVTLMSSPEWIMDMIIRIVAAILNALPRIAKALIDGFFKLGGSLIDALVDGIFGGLTAAVSSIINAVKNAFGFILGLFGINIGTKKPTPPNGGNKDELPDGFLPIDEYDPLYHQKPKRPGYSVDTSGSRDVAGNLAYGGDRGAGNGQNVTNITYTQNNTSPQPLSAIEIYRNTEKQLAMMG